MRIKFLTLAALVALQTLASAQPPGGQGGRGEGRGPGGQGGPGGGEDAVARLMALDKNNDGKLTEDEYGDSRLKPLLERADADKNKVITREELTAQMQREMQNQGGGQGGPGFGGGQGGGPGFGGGPGGGQGFGGGQSEGGMGRGGRGGMRGGMMMRPGTVLPEFMVQELQLTEEQRSKLAKLQATVDAELAKILTESQQQQMKQFGERGREGFGRDGGREGGREGFGREGGREGGGRFEGGRPEGQGPGGQGPGGQGGGPGPGPGAGPGPNGGPGGGRPEGQGGPGDRPRF